MESDGMEKLVCGLHGKQFVDFCDEHSLLLCPDCDKHESCRHKKLTELIEDGTGKMDQLPELKKRAAENIELNKKRLSNVETSIKLTETSVKVVKGKIESFKVDSENDKKLFVQLIEKLAELAKGAQSQALKNKVSLIMKKTFGDDEISKEEAKMNEEMKKQENKLNGERKEFNKIYQKVLVMNLLMDMKEE